jgi:hypothetical protein
VRRLAAAGDDHARRQLASWLSDRAFPEGPGGLAKVEEAIEVIRPLADHDLLDELQDHISTGGGIIRSQGRRMPWPAQCPFRGCW